MANLYKLNNEQVKLITHAINLHVQSIYNKQNFTENTIKEMEDYANIISILQHPEEVHTSTLGVYIPTPILFPF